MKLFVRALGVAVGSYVALGAWASSGVIELERPEIDEATKAAISAFNADPSPETLAALKESIAANYDAVVARKIDKLHELEETARDQALVDEMQEIVDDMLEFKWQRVDQNVIRFADKRFRADYRTPVEGFLPLLGGAADLYIAYTPVTNEAYAAFDPAHTFAADEADHPVVNVSYDDALAYCAFLTETSPNYTYTYRLPSQEEWELAAGHMPKDASINAAGVFPSTTAVTTCYELYGNSAVAACGALDMWGNVWEWTTTEAEAGQQKVKGGAFDAERSECRTEERGIALTAAERYPNVGFRVLRAKNWPAAVLQDANAARWLEAHVPELLPLAPADYALLDADSDGDGMSTWQEYIALSDPNDASSSLRATLAFDAANTPIPGHTLTPYASRTYTLYGKVSLSDPVWLEVRDNAASYHFFKVEVSLNSLPAN